MDNRQRIADAALALFVAHGYDAVGVQEIVGRAGVTKPSLYHHFGSKRGLLDALADELERSMFSLLADATVYSHDLPRDLEAIFGRLLDFARAQPEQTRLLLAGQNGPVGSDSRRALAGVWQRLSTEVKRLFVEAADDHGNMRGHEADYAVSLLGVAAAYMVLELDGRFGDRFDDDSRRAHAIMRQFSYGIYS